MKVIVKGLIIETGFIVSIRKVWRTGSAAANGTFLYLELVITTIFGAAIKINNLGATDEFYLEPDEDAKALMIEIEKEADRIIKFLDDHSDKPSLPYPVFE